MIYDIYIILFIYIYILYLDTYTHTNIQIHDITLQYIIIQFPYPIHHILSIVCPVKWSVDIYIYIYMYLYTYNYIYIYDSIYFNFKQTKCRK